MSKLPYNKRFIDVSDYGRPFAQALVQRLINTPFTSNHLTFAFLVAGLIAIGCILVHQFAFAAFFLMVKNILDAADGEMARQRSRPSYTGRYLDSIFDFVINLGICYALYLVTDSSLLVLVAAFLGLQFQCAICNYYYVIQRNRVDGDMTSRIVEFKKPTAFPYESQTVVNLLHSLFMVFYSPFDFAVLRLDKNAIKLKEFPNWFLSLSSSLLLGFQYAIIAIFLLLNLAEYILPFFAFYSLWGLVVIGTRKLLVQNA
ncbi:MAG: CDP-alcohol phosphatidyltransferase family protein [Saprospiraceae bacterium]|nr:CDP-alcohol phosphatidyltransferase family protein [Saprospiraceae bacterium]MCF8249580.1 CDP-alcohol phosphatidyltransferase family protein [Saprospiraceae bacterium]MCF8280480.1 CDP-alcohol phosphatidyltransferase family protein [Bacteroidales bacterium]MCF8310412.1 CDP-alcohol phosphatidyltransferase family protein [Saprospiraceae bacterium]MCF8439790.1 CDP-alcohol phosphatidyltransferase family protein [Saprospiraceae bacterium]